VTERLFVDTNVWVCAVDVADRAKQARARAVTAPGQGSDIVVSSQVLSEFYVVTTRKLARPLAEADAAAMVERLADLPVVSVDADLVSKAIASSRQWHISFWDALIIRAAQSAGCNVVLSEDLAGDREYGPVSVRDPFR
jgi:predicted nucleic acid-binding protein